MKTILLVTMLSCGLLSPAAAQDEVVKAGAEACACLRALDPEKVSRRDLNMSMLGCLSKPIDGIAEAMKQRNAWADSLAMVYLDKIRKEARAACPSEFERLKKKEVVVDPALLKIQPDSETVPAFAQAVCNCLQVVKDVNDCMGKVGQANEEELKKRYPDSDPLSVMMNTGMDVMFELADHCESASFNETIAQLKKIPAIKEGCNKIVLGEFSTKTILGETITKFTPTKMTEYENGKLNVEYDMKWSGCTITLTCTTSNSTMTKKGEVSTMEVRRASSEGFIAFVSFGKMRVPVNYTKVK